MTACGLSKEKPNDNTARRQQHVSSFWTTLMKVAREEGVVCDWQAEGLEGNNRSGHFGKESDYYYVFS